MRGSEFEFSGTTNSINETNQILLMSREDINKTYSESKNEELQLAVEQAVNSSLKKLLQEATTPNITDTAILPEYTDSSSSEDATVTVTDSDPNTEPTPEEIKEETPSTVEELKEECGADTQSDPEREEPDVPPASAAEEYPEESDRLEQNMNLYPSNKDLLYPSISSQIDKIKNYKSIMQQRFRNTHELREYLADYAEQYYLDPRLYVLLRFIYTEMQPWLYVMDERIFEWKKYYFSSPYGEKNELDFFIQDFKQQIDAM